MGLRSLLASARDAEDTVEDSPITGLLRASRTAGVTSLPDPLELPGSPRSEGAVYALAASLAADLGPTLRCNEAFSLWASRTVLRRHLQIGLQWWLHAASASVMLVWGRRARFRRVLGAARREARWAAAARALTCWQLLSNDRLMTRFGCIAADASCLRRRFAVWVRRCEALTTRRVLVDGRMLAAVTDVAQRHQRESSLRTTLGKWRLIAVRALLTALDTRGAWQPVARHAMRVWLSGAQALLLRELEANERRLGLATLSLARALRSWRVHAARGPLDRLAAERAQLGATVIAFDRWRRRADDRILGSLGRPRNRRGAAARAARIAVAGSAGRHAVLAAARHSWRTWQIRRLERSLARHAKVRCALEQAAIVVVRWNARASGAVRSAHLNSFGGSMRTVVSLRRGWRALSKSALAYRLAKSLSAAQIKSRGRTLAMAIHRWHMSGRVAWPLYVQILRCFEIARALLLLFRWRHWSDACLEARNNRLLAETLPLVHGTQRWRGRAAQRGAKKQLYVRLSLRPRAKKLPPAWQLWLAFVRRQRRAHRRLENSVMHAVRSLTARAFAKLSRSRGRRSRLRFALTHRKVRLMAAALLKWRWRHADSIAHRATAGVIRCVRDGQAAVRRARAFGMWVRWQHVRTPRRAKSLHGSRVAGWRAARGGWLAICSAAARGRVHAHATRTISERRAARALARWYCMCRLRLTTLVSVLGWRLRALRVAVICWHEFVTARPDRSSAIKVFAYRQRKLKLRSALARLSAGCRRVRASREVAGRAVIAARRLQLRHGMRVLRRVAQRRTTQLFLGSLLSGGGGGRASHAEPSSRSVRRPPSGRPSRMPTPQTQQSSAAYASPACAPGYTPGTALSAFRSLSPLLATGDAPPSKPRRAWVESGEARASAAGLGRTRAPLSANHAPPSRQPRQVPSRGTPQATRHYRTPGSSILRESNVSSLDGRSSLGVSPAWRKQLTARGLL